MALKKGSNGNEVTQLQSQLANIGYGVTQDGQFGPRTLWAVKNVQAMFGYDVDGIAGPATQTLIEQQLGYGWNAKNEDAQQKALQAQGL